MNLILRVILASIVSLPVAAIFLVVGMGIFFLTPFASTPLFSRLPGVSESFCPDGAVQLIGIECGLRSNAWADVNFRKSPALTDDLRRLSVGDNVAKAQVVLMGRFEDRQQACFGVQFEISDAELEWASQISVVNITEEIKREGVRNAE